MSFVSIVGTTKFISVMSDGRVSNNGVPVDENFRKVERYNDSFVAFTGTLGNCLKLKKFILENLKNGMDYSSLAELVNKEILKIKEEGGQMNISFGGKKSSGDIEFYVFSTNKVGYDVHKLFGDRMEFHFLANPALLDTGFDLEGRFACHLDESNGSVDVAQQKLNDEVADNDNSVNKKVFNEVIQ